MASLTFLKKTLMAASATVIALVSGEAAQAITFDFAGSGNDTVVVFEQDGIFATVTGTADGNTARVTSQSFGTSQGLGVLSSFEDSSQVDGLDMNEVLKLELSQVVSLVSATFSRVGSDDSFQLLVNGNELVSADILGGNNFDADSSVFDFTSFALPNRTGSIFEFTVTGESDDYFLSSIEVEPVAEPVPEPLTILGSLSALGMGTFLKKQQKKS